MANDNMQALIDAQAQLAQEFIHTWEEAETDYDTTKSPDSIKRHFSQRDWPLDAVFRDHELWIRTDGREGTQANFQGCDLSVLDVCWNLEDYDGFLVPYITLNGLHLQGAIF